MFISIEIKKKEKFAKVNLKVHIHYYLKFPKYNYVIYV